MKVHNTWLQIAPAYYRVDQVLTPNVKKEMQHGILINDFSVFEAHSKFKKSSSFN